LARPIGLHLGLDLRNVVPGHDDIVDLAIAIPDMVPQQSLGLEAEAFEERDRRLLAQAH
jgi:hypothetical protein